jgi:hypothetical protein
MWPNYAPAPNRRLRFPLGGLVEIACKSSLSKQNGNLRSKCANSEHPTFARTDWGRTQCVGQWGGAPLPQYLRILCSVVGFGGCYKVNEL